MYVCIPIPVGGYAFCNVKFMSTLHSGSARAKSDLFHQDFEAEFIETEYQFKPELICATRHQTIPHRFLSNVPYQVNRIYASETKTLKLQSIACPYHFSRNLKF